MAYVISPISIERKADLVAQFQEQILYEVKSDIYGCCIKLLTNSREVRNRFEDNFYLMSQNIRSHGRIYVVEDKGFDENSVLYDQASKTLFLVNMDYYGWIKSLSLSLAGDILEDEHGIYSVHGACLDIDGKGLVMLGASGAGKTTHTYGLIRDARVRVVSDDWLFGRIYGSDVLAYGSEKNFYIRAELSAIWKDFAWLIQRSEMDAKGRGVIDIRWAIGKGRILPLTTIRNVIVLVRGNEGTGGVSKLSKDSGLELLEKNGLFNPHLLVRNDFKASIRRNFFKSLLSSASIYVVNTAGTPEESQHLIRGVVGLDGQERS